MSHLVHLPGTGLWVNPRHVVYVQDREPYERGTHPGKPRVEVCTTMYGRYRTDDVFGMTAAQVAQILAGVVG